MGVLTDFILGTQQELASVPADQAPISVLPGIDMKGVDPVKLEVLLGHLTGREFDPDLKAFPTVSGQASPDGPWVYGCSEDLVRKLAALDDVALATLASWWANTEEFRLDRWETHSVKSVLHEMRAFAQRSLAVGKPIHIWVSL